MDKATMGGIRPGKLITMAIDKQRGKSIVNELMLRDYNATMLAHKAQPKPSIVIYDEAYTIAWPKQTAVNPLAKAIRATTKGRRAW